MTWRENIFYNDLGFPPSQKRVVEGWLVHPKDWAIPSDSQFTVLSIPEHDQSPSVADKILQMWPVQNCQVNQVVHQKYKTKHASHCADESTCDSGGLVVDELTGAVKEGHIPLVGFDYMATPPVLHIFWFEEDTGFYNVYVAISQVWSDRMAYPLYNTLPIC